MTIKDIIADMMKNLKPSERDALDDILDGNDDTTSEKEFWKEQGFDPEWTDWEKKVKKKLHNSSISFEEKFRKFPLEIDTNNVIYQPDFVLDFSYKNRKRVIVEVQEKRSLDEIKKYQTFVDVYGRVYWLIMVVTEEELRNWNEVSKRGLPVCHDIWTLPNIDDMIVTLEKLRKHLKEQDEKEKAVCPRCKKTAQGKLEVTELFGYRYGGKRVQSYCRTCRSSKKSEPINNEMFQKNPLTVDCTFCGKTYLEKVRGEACCQECLEKWNS